MFGVLQRRYPRNLWAKALTKEKNRSENHDWVEEVKEALERGKKTKEARQRQ